VWSRHHSALNDGGDGAASVEGVEVVTPPEQR